MCLHTRYSQAKIQSWKIQKTMKIVDLLHISTNPADWVDNQKNITVKKNFFNHLFNKNVDKFFLLRKKQLNLKHHGWYLAQLTSCRFNWRIFYYHRSLFLITWLLVCFVFLSCSDLSWNRLSSVKPNSFSALPALTKLWVLYPSEHWLVVLKPFFKNSFF